MPTAPEAVRGQLAVVATAATADLEETMRGVEPRKLVSTARTVLPLLVPSYYDAAGALAVAWYIERRDQSHPTSIYVPAIIGDPATDWIDREVAAFQKTLDADLEVEALRLRTEMADLVGKEVARGFRDSIIGNTRQDQHAVGWSRVARPGSCKFCAMLAARGAVFTEATVHFAAHANCHCAAQPEFRGGRRGPEASVEQYLASTKRRTPAQRAQLREYLNHHYPDAPG